MIRFIRENLEKNKILRSVEIMMIAALLLLSGFLFISGFAKLNACDGNIEYVGTVKMERQFEEEDYDEDDDDYFYEIESDDKESVESDRNSVKTPNRTIKYGDVYKIKNNIIMFGDSDDEDDLMELERIEEDELLLDNPKLQLIKTLNIPINYYITSDYKLLESLVDSYKGTDNFSKLK